jgi:hypothetical protein
VLQWHAETNQEENMRTIVLALLAAVAIGFAGTTGSSAAPANGAAIGSAANALRTTEQVHCRRYPHRHVRGIPHGWGFGCR